MKILFPIVEYEPLVSVGDLGVNVAKLIDNLALRDIEVEICMPLYKKVIIQDLDFTPVLFPDTNSNIRLINGHRASFWKTVLNNKEITFIKNESFFSSRSNIYGYGDDNYRFVFFSLGVLELIKHKIYNIDVIHIYDWHTAILPLLLSKEKIDIPTVLTINNISHQGLSSPKILDFIGLSEDYLNADQLEFFKMVNLLKAGIIYSDKIITNSASYFENLQESNYLSGGLSGLLRSLRSKFLNISPGVDDVFNPENDSSLAKSYSFHDISGKIKCKSELQKELDLPVHSEIPIILIPSLYSTEDEFILLNSIIPYLIKMEIQIVIIGNRLADFEKNIRGVSLRMNCVVVSVENNIEMQKKVFSGADIFLDLSSSEANKHLIKIAIKYGVIPISISENKDLNLADNQFRIFNFTTDDLINTIKYTINKYYYLEKWNDRVKSGMTYDYSWDQSIKKYSQLYESMMYRNHLP